MPGIDSTPSMLLSPNTFIHISLVISMLVYTGYSERRITKMETIIETQQERIVKIEDKSLSPGEVMFRLNKIETTLEGIQKAVQAQR